MKLFDEQQRLLILKFYYMPNDLYHCIFYQNNFAKSQMRVLLPDLHLLLA